MIRDTCWSWLRIRSEAGVWRILHKGRIRRRRGQPHVHSPDPRYDEKRLRVQQLDNDCNLDDEKHVLYLDEVSYERQPTLASAWHPMDEGQPRAELSHSGDAVWRFVGAVDAHTGQLFTMDRKRITVGTLNKFFKQLALGYPKGHTLYVVMDNWPVHVHPDLLRRLQPQPFADDFIYPPSWSDMIAERAQRKPYKKRLPIVLVPLPTYSPWLNPIEKLWGKSRREISHMHRHADDFDTLKQRLRDFFDTFQHPSPDLLKEIGICRN